MAGIVSEGNYTRVFTEDGSSVLKLCLLKEWRKIAPEGIFCQVYRGDSRTSRRSAGKFKMKASAGGCFLRAAWWLPWAAPTGLSLRRCCGWNRPAPPLFVTF